MKKFILLSALVLSACATQDKRVDTVIATDSNGNPMQVRRSMSQREFIEQQKQSAMQTTDVAIANASAECWKSYHESQKQPDIVIPEGASFEGVLLLTMMNNQTQTIKALAEKDKPQMTPCSTIGANSNDVKINAENAKTEKHRVWSGVAKSIAPIAIGGYAAVKTVDAVANLAAAGINAAGNKTTINGDGNSANATSQHADNQSTIADSGNYTEAGGIPLAEGEVAPVALGAAESSESSLCPEGTTLRPANETDAPEVIVNGMTCSDGNGNEVAPSG